jgi:hypothetical protein
LLFDHCEGEMDVPKPSHPRGPLLIEQQSSIDDAFSNYI